MESRKLIINRKAALSYYRVALWYHVNKGYSFAETFEQNIKETVDTIVKTPTIGRFEKKLNNREYRSFLSHPLSRIYYWFNTSEVHIVEILSTKSSTDF